jgi:hypothetical protein
LSKKDFYIDVNSLLEKFFIGISVSIQSSALANSITQDFQSSNSVLVAVVTKRELNKAQSVIFLSVQVQAS